MEGGPRQLPSPIEKVKLPFFLAPSHLHALEQCPLMVFGRPSQQSDILPPKPEALLGTLIHHVRDQLASGRTGSSKDGREAFSIILDKATSELNSLLGCNPRTCRFGSIQDALGRRYWKSKIHDSIEWASRLKLRPTGDQPASLESPLDHSQSQHDDAEDMLETGSEAWIISRSCRIRGRVDLLVADGVKLQIFEFKTGRIYGDDNKILDQHLVQIRMYALAVSSLEPDRMIQLFLESKSAIPIHWDETIAAKCASDLDLIHRRYPAGTEMKSRTLARPGKTCFQCRLRSVCSSYLSEAPSWWSERRKISFPIPYDVWGRVLSVKSNGTTSSILLGDAASRKVKVEGLTSYSVRDVTPGMTLYFFDLESKEPRSMHAMRVQPRNFHEIPMVHNSRYKNAVSLQTFRN